MSATILWQRCIDLSIIATSCGLLNQWLVLERRPQRDRHSSWYFVAVYIVASELVDHIWPDMPMSTIHLSVTLPLHLVIASITSLIATGDDNPEFAPLWQCLILTPAVITTAASNIALVWLLKRLQAATDSWELIMLGWTIAVALISRLGDLVICDRMQRYKFFLEGGMANAGPQLTTYVLMSSAQGIVRAGIVHLA